MSDRDFESALFALYGEPSRAWGDEGVTERVLRRIKRESLLRDILSGAAMIAGGAMAAAVAATFGGPLLMGIVAATGAAPAMVWSATMAGAAVLGAVGIRAALEA